MKRILLIVFALLLTSTFLSAQTYRIDTSELSFENKLRPCFNVKYDADARTVKKAWSNFVKKNYRIKTKGVNLFSDKDVVSAEDVTIGSISDKRMNMYIRATDEAGGSEMKFFMSFGYDFFIGPENYSKEFGGMKKLLNDFSVEFLNDYYADEASSLIRQIKRLEKDKKKNLSLIEKNNNKAKKESSAVASGLEAKNNSLEMENNQIDDKILDIKNKIEEIKIKQSGITRN